MSFSLRELNHTATDTLLGGDSKGADAIPVNRMVLDPLLFNAKERDCVRQPHDAPPVGDLYLRPGKYNMTFSAEDGAVLYRQKILVPDGESAEDTSKR